MRASLRLAARRPAAFGPEPGLQRPKCWGPAPCSVQPHVLRGSVSQERPVARMASRTAPPTKPVLLLDIMDTVVYDPFFNDMPAFFQMSFKELLAAKHPSAWVEFECGTIDEDELVAKFFADGRPVDAAALKEMMVMAYRYLDGMEPLLARLSEAGYPLHALSNYPAWYRMIEEKLRPSRYLSWTFISCEGPMKGLRKPAREAYEACIQELGVEASQIIFVDDRKVNVEGAAVVGMDAILFQGAANLEAELRNRGLQF